MQGLKNIVFGIIAGIQKAAFRIAITGFRQKIGPGGAVDPHLAEHGGAGQRHHGGSQGGHYHHGNDQADQNAPVLIGTAFIC